MGSIYPWTKSLYKELVTDMVSIANSLELFSEWFDYSDKTGLPETEGRLLMDADFLYAIEDLKKCLYLRIGKAHTIGTTWKRG